MARIRTIKPEFFTSEDIVSLSPLARLLYIALWCESDKEGRMVWKPMTFKLRYMPGDNCDISAICQEILDKRLVVLYGEGYAYIPAFLSHQHINPRETASQLPEPDAKVTRGSRVGTRGARDHDAQGGREGKGREGKEDHASGFDEFWTAYPKKKAKDEALKAFEKRNPDQETLVLMLAAIEWQRKSEDWAKDAGKFIPHPATWLNDGRWKDEKPGTRTIHDICPKWCIEAGFTNVNEANNERCYERNHHEFRDGKKILEVA